MANPYLTTNLSTALASLPEAYKQAQLQKEQEDLRKQDLERMRQSLAREAAIRTGVQNVMSQGGEMTPERYGQLAGVYGAQGDPNAIKMAEAASAMTKRQEEEKTINARKSLQEVAHAAASGMPSEVVNAKLSSFQKFGGPRISYDNVDGEHIFSTYGPDGNVTEQASLSTEGLKRLASKPEDLHIVMKEEEAARAKKEAMAFKEKELEAKQDKWDLDREARLETAAKRSSGLSGEKATAFAKNVAFVAANKVKNGMDPLEAENEAISEVSGKTMKPYQAKEMRRKYISSMMSAYKDDMTKKGRDAFAYWSNMAASELSNSQEQGQPKQPAKYGGYASEPKQGAWRQHPTDPTLGASYYNGKWNKKKLVNGKWMDM